MNKRYCIIMAGGVGSRFWPISRRSLPKQFLDILGTGKSFIRMTYERFAKIVPPENFLVATNSAYKALVMQHLPEISESQILCEPVGRNTAPCIAYAAWKLQTLDPEATMIITPADHLILNEDEFVKAINESADFAEANGVMMTIGIKPNRPDTGYGYIQVDTKEPNDTIDNVKTFTEKPDLEMAKVFLESGEFYWNSGIFIWSVKTIMKNMDKFLPEIQEIFSSAQEHYNTESERAVIEKIYPEARNISIDVGVMEKAKGVYVRRSEFGWSDIGTWGALYQHSGKDENGNVINGETLTYNSTGNLIKAPKGKVVIVDSLDEYIVVDTDDALLICPRKNEQNVKSYIEAVKFKLGDRYN